MTLNQTNKFHLSAGLCLLKPAVARPSTKFPGLNFEPDMYKCQSQFQRDPSLFKSPANKIKPNL